MTHAILPPSGAPQWAHCSGSVMANMHAPDLESEASLKGDAVHWVGAETLLAWVDPAGKCPPCSDLVGAASPKGVIIDEEMAEGAQVYVDDVLDVCQKHGALRSLMVEKRVHMHQIHKDNWGTLDAAIYLPEKRLIFIWDYKNGHRENRARDNFQMIDYLAGLMNEFGINGIADQEIKVVMRIVQPFCYKTIGAVDEWYFTLSDLRPYFNQLVAKANDALTNPTMSTGPWCRDCGAVKSCTAARKASYSFIDYVNLPYEMDTMDGQDLAVERRILAKGMIAAKARLEAIEDDLTHRISQGATDTGLALQASTGNLAWTIPAPQAVALAGNFNGDIAKHGVLTPTQAKAKIPRELRSQFEHVLKTVTKRPSGGLKLTDAEDTIGACAFKRK